VILAFTFRYYIFGLVQSNLIASSRIHKIGQKHVISHTCPFEDIVRCMAWRVRSYISNFTIRMTDISLHLYFS